MSDKYTYYISLRDYINTVNYIKKLTKRYKQLLVLKESKPSLDLEKELLILSDEIQTKQAILNSTQIIDNNLNTSNDTIEPGDIILINIKDKKGSRDVILEIAYGVPSFNTNHLQVPSHSRLGKMNLGKKVGESYSYSYHNNNVIVTIKSKLNNNYIEEKLNKKLSR